MLIYAKHYGQMCNNLWSILPSIAFAIEKKVKLYVLFARKDYIICFPQITKCPYVKFLFTTNNHPKWVWRVSHFSRKNHLELEGELRMVSNVPLLSFINGWEHSGDLSFIFEHRDELLELFQPSEFIRCRVLLVLNNYCGITIGVHVRRGDYKNYLEGKYYYDDGVYLNIMIDIKKQIESKGIQCRFLICSNELQTWNHYNIDIIRISNSDSITDLYALSKCDYIIGPPSSFSQWASFIGHVPLACILNIDSVPLIEEFSSIIYFNVFENGRTLEFQEDKQKYVII